MLLFEALNQMDSHLNAVIAATNWGQATANSMANARANSLQSNKYALPTFLLAFRIKILAIICYTQFLKVEIYFKTLVMSLLALY